MGFEKGFGLARVFCTAFKQNLVPTQTSAKTAAASGSNQTSIFSSKSSILSYFFVRFSNKACSKHTGAVGFLCVKHNTFFGQRSFSSTSNCKGPKGRLKFSRGAILLTKVLLELRLFFLQNFFISSTMLGGSRRRSLRLSASRREPLTEINNLTNANNGLNSEDQHERPITVAVEGNIGSGKSTLLKYFQAQDGVQVVMEPVQKWRENKGVNMLDLTYRDPSRWGFTFQSFVQLTMLEQHRIPHTAPIKMMERSIYSAKYCFVENLYRSKHMNTSEYMVLTEWFDWIVNTQDLKVDQIVYLRTSPEMCQKRIRHRCRSEEQGIPMQYLQELHELHEEWLVQQNKFKLPAPVMILDASKPLEQMMEVFNEQRDQILLQS